METNNKLLMENPAMYLTPTERDEVQNLSQILVLLCVKPQPVVISMDEDSVAKWASIKMAILFEGIAREMRNYAKRRNQLEDTAKICRKMLGISDESCFNPTPIDDPEPQYEDEAHSSEYSADSITEIAAEFDKNHRMIDISRMLTFVEYWQRLFFGEYKYHLSAFKTHPEEELDSFFVKLREKLLIVIDTPVASHISPIVKASMVIQGLLNPETKQRKDGLPPVHTPHLAQQELAISSRKLRKALYQVRLAEKIKTLSIRDAEKRIKQAQEEQQLEQTDFLVIHHGNARAFTHKEITEMNKSRPLGDQLQLTIGSHMLVHHCGYPNCPYYLKNLATASDLQTGNNSGLWNHLRGFFYPKQKMITGFHSRCFTVLRGNPNISEEKYTADVKRF